MLATFCDLIIARLRPWQIMLWAAVMFAAILPARAQDPAAFTPPKKLVVTSDENYPPYLFRDSEGRLQGILKDKWDLWAARTGVAVELRGVKWVKAQDSVRSGEADVIDALVQTEARSRQYEFSRVPSTMEAHAYFHRSITGIHDAASMRGFTVAAKEGSACADWLRTHGVESIRKYPDSETLVVAAGQGEVRVFCMDAPTAEYFLFKHALDHEFRQSPVLYSAPFDWAVRRGQAALRDFVDAGFTRIRPTELAAIDARWRGNPLRLPISRAYLYILAIVACVVLGFASLMLVWNRTLRRHVSGKTSELVQAAENLKKQAAQAQYLATRDALTDLPNRDMMKDRLSRSMELARRRERRVGVLFIDLDRFKSVNDTFGQDFGDGVLQEIANRLRACARTGDIVTRHSGDEFVMIAANLESADDAATIASKVLAEIHHAVDLAGKRVYCTASVGIAMFPADGIKACDLIRHADIAMDCAKERGRNNFQFYLPGMRDLAARRLELETSLRGALERNEFELHYQPKVSLKTERVSGFEALLRWRHPQHGLLSPVEFVPILEDTGLIMPVGEWVLRTACAQVKRWECAGLSVVPIAVNLSAMQFGQRDLDVLVARIIDESGIDAQLLELELTESALMREPEEAARMLRRLESFGVRIAVDDFGTGYSSLAYLKRFPIDALKIDRTFIRDVTINAEDAAITQAIIQLAHGLGLRVIAEGVETEAQRQLLTQQDCDEMQGFLFSPPVAAEAADLFLTPANGTPRP
jgi:diguanylate cyclase (GGDEF)-like protein